MGESAPRVLALDLGSSSVRALVFDSDLQPAGGGPARRPVVLRADELGAATLDPDETVAAVAVCLDELHERGVLDGLSAVAMSCQWHSLLAVAGDGRPLTPVLTWADSRAPAPAGGTDEGGELHRRTGAWLDRLYWTAKIPWLRDRLGTAPAGFAGLAEYVRSALCGDGSCSVSMASGTGLLDLETMTWDDEACSLAGVRAGELPALATEGEAGEIVRERRSRWPGLAGVPWLPAVGDGAASNVGAGCGNAARISLTVGTSAAVRVVEPADGAGPLGEGHWRYRVDPDRVVTGVAYSAGGNLREWVESLFAAGVSAELDRVVPGSHGLTAVPFQPASRPPLELPEANGLVAGLGLQTTAAEIAAAVLEGVCLETEIGLRGLERTLPARPEPVLNGGAIHDSPWWQRAWAALLGAPLLVCGEREMAARGAALLALGRELDPPYDLVEPDPEAVAAMAGARERYERMRALALASANRA